MFYTYILYSEKYNLFYVGYCEDLPKRLERHNAGKVTFTRKYMPWKLKYYEVFETRVEAIRRERYIKRQKSRQYIERLIREAEMGRHVPIEDRDSQP